MSILFLNFSSDKICLQTSHSTLVLPHHRSEYEVPIACHQLFQDHKIIDMIVLNGPGGFTSLRIGSLVSTMMSVLHPGHITLYSISKPELYSLFPCLGSKIVMRIGQQKNYRLYTIQDDTYQTIQDIYPYDVRDQLYTDTYQPYGDRMIHIQVVENGLSVSYRDQTIILSVNDLIPYRCDPVNARYYIEPSITPKIIPTF